MDCKPVCKIAIIGGGVGCGRGLRSQMIRDLAAKLGDSVELVELDFAKLERHVAAHAASKRMELKIAYDSLDELPREMYTRPSKADRHTFTPPHKARSTRLRKRK